MAKIDPQSALPSRLQALLCPVCMELAFDAMANQCGHTFCGECSKKLKNCSLCRANVNLSTNFMVRSVLEDDPEVQGHRKQYQRRAFLNTPQGRIQGIVSKHPGLTYTKKRFCAAEVACILKWIDLKLSDPTSEKDTHPFGPGFVTVWSPCADVALMGSGQYFKCCVANQTILVLPYQYTTTCVAGSHDNDADAEPMESHEDEL